MHRTAADIPLIRPAGAITSRRIRSVPNVDIITGMAGSWIRYPATIIDKLVGLSDHTLVLAGQGISASVVVNGDTVGKGSPENPSTYGPADSSLSSLGFSPSFAVDHVGKEIVAITSLPKRADLVVKDDACLNLTAGDAVSRRSRIESAVLNVLQVFNPGFLYSSQPLQRYPPQKVKILDVRVSSENL